MSERLGTFFSTQGFMPHGHCYLWRPELVATHVISDFLIGSAYVAISLSLYLIVRRIRLPFSPVVLSFGLFIGACGATHFMEIWNLWHADYWLGGLVKILTACASVATSVWLIRLRPQIFAVAESAKLAERQRVDLEALTKSLEERVSERTSQLELSRQRAEDQARQLAVSESLYRTVFDFSPQPMWYFNVESKRFLDVNRAAIHQYGYTKEEFLQRTIIDLRPSDQIAPTEAYIEAVKVQPEGRSPDTKIFTHIRKDGSRLQVEITATLIEFRGEPAMVVIANDVTARVQAESEREKLASELKAAKTAAEAANETKTLFLANMSHEIRTPLGAMLGFADLALEHADQKKDRELWDYLATIERNGRQLYRIVDDILDIAKVEADKLDIELGRTSLRGLLSDVENLLTVKAQGKNLAFSVGADDDVPDEIETDPTRLKQILMNVVGNALKFTEKGSVKCWARIGNETDDKHLTIFVEDTGPGISPEMQARLFQPFMQADLTHTRRHGGTGLGLYLSLRLARALGGDLRITQCSAGKGCTFALTLPRLAESRTTVSRTLSSTERARNEAHRLKGIRVLVVDDSPDNLQLTYRYLKNAGAAEVACFESATQALDLLGREPYDVVLMDIQMPVLDGYTAVRMLRERSYKGPILALTAHAMKGERERCLTAGFDDYLIKPIDRMALIGAICTHANWPT